MESLIALIFCWHYEKSPIKIYWKFYKKKKKKKKFQIKDSQNIDCGYAFESPREGGSNEYPQSMF